MANNKSFEVIIIGGSYAGLSAGMALGRSLREVLIIDSGTPCNAQTPHSHNFITQDGATPAAISSLARQQVTVYPSVHFYEGTAVKGGQTASGFKITTDQGDEFSARKLIFATGVKDQFPDIEGFADCWGISVIHCPYCHGYEVRNETTGIFSNGDVAFEFSKMINNWTKDLTVFTNGKSTLTDEQTTQLSKHNIRIVDAAIEKLEHENGHLKQVVLADGQKIPLKAMYAKIPFTQHSDIPEQIGCALTEHGHIEVDNYQRTSVGGVYACGDNTTLMRAVSSAVAAGGVAGAVCNRELIDADF